MGELFENHATMARVLIIWAMGIVTIITLVWATNVDSMTSPAAALGSSICAVFGIAALSWRKARGIE